MMVVLLKGQVPAALAGLALTYAAHISGVFQFTIRLLSETESRFISVERMQTAIQVLGGSRKIFNLKMRGNQDLTFCLRVAPGCELEK